MRGLGFGKIRYCFLALWFALATSMLGGCTSDIKEAQFVWRDRCQNIIERGAISMIKHHNCFRVCVKNYANPCRQMCENQLMQAKADRKIILTTCRIKFTRFVRRQCTLYCEMSTGQLARKMAQRRRDRILGRRHSFCDEDDNDIYAEVRPFGQVQADDDEEEQMLIDLFDKNQNDDQLLVNLFGDSASGSTGQGRTTSLGDDLDSTSRRDEPQIDTAPVGASVGYPAMQQPMVVAPSAAPASGGGGAGSGALSLLSQGLQAFTTLKGQQMQNQAQITEQQLQEQTQLQQQQLQNQSQLQQQQMQLYGSSPTAAAAAALSNPSTVGALQSLGSSIGSGVSSLIPH